MPADALSLRPVLEGVVLLAAVGVAASLRPWRSTGLAGPPWPWLLTWAALPLMWGIDHWVAMPLAQPMSLVPLLTLMAGWPLAVLAVPPAAMLTALAADLGWAEALHRAMWLGLVPATLMLAFGAALRRWLPNHLFVYILGRGFFATFASCALADGIALSLRTLPEGSALADLWIARPITAFGEAFLTGMLIAILVAFRPQWLSTYSDRLYLPK